MSLIHNMVVGTTESQDFALLDEGVAIVGTGFTLGIDWRGTDPAGPPTVAWLSQAGGTVRVSNTGSMALGKYFFRFTLTDSGGKLNFVPNLDLEANIWRVVRV